MSHSWVCMQQARILEIPSIDRLGCQGEVNRKPEINVNGSGDLICPWQILYDADLICEVAGGKQFANVTIYENKSGYFSVYKRRKESVPVKFSAGGWQNDHEFDIGMMFDQISHAT